MVLLYIIRFPHHFMKIVLLWGIEGHKQKTKWIQKRFFP